MHAHPNVDEQDEVAIPSSPNQCNELVFKERTAFARLRVTRRATGFCFATGPVWLPREQALVFSDIQRSTMWKWNETSGLTVFRTPSSFANGNAIYPNGDLLTCEHGSRSLTRTTKDGIVSTVIDRYLGKRFNSPNDVVIDRDGVIWFTDPPYGLEGGHSEARERELPANYIFRFDPSTQSLEVVAQDLDRPNGLAFSPDENILYVADSGMLRGQGPDGKEIFDEKRPCHIRSFAVEDGRRLTPIGVLAEIEVGAPDGIKVDFDGNVWSSAGDGVHCFSPEGVHKAHVPIPEVVGNIAFDANGRLFATASSSLYLVEMTKA